MMHKAWNSCCSVSCFMLGNQESSAVALKLGCAMVADLTPPRPVHSLSVPCSWVNVGRLQCCFEDIFVPLVLTTPGLQPSSMQLFKEENLGDAIFSSHHMAGPKRLRCHDDRLHPCDNSSGGSVFGILSFHVPCDPTSL